MEKQMCHFFSEHGVEATMSERRATHDVGCFSARVRRQSVADSVAGWVARQCARGPHGAPRPSWGRWCCARRALVVPAADAAAEPAARNDAAGPQVSLEPHAAQLRESRTAEHYLGKR